MERRAATGPGSREAIAGLERKGAVGGGMDQGEGDLSFPEGFLFGAATAAFQIEGASEADGKGPSIWDAFTRRAGSVRTGENGDIACDHYHRYREDVSLMAELGLDAYRGSIAWPRIYPEGRGRVNPAGLDFYSRLTDALLAAGIEPFFTLFHWDLPQRLQRELGGFRSRETAALFADYVETVVRALGDRVRRWITINEPWEFAFFGHVLGEQAPGVRNPLAYLPVIHNLLLAHGLALERIRALRPKSEVGVALSYTPIFPATESARDAWSAAVGNAFMNHISLKPLLKGRYPELIARRLRLFFPRMERGDLELISRPLDFVGINYYSRERASYRWYVPFLRSWITGRDSAEGVERTAMGWEVWPEGFGHILSVLRKDYGNPPVYITENGAAFVDSLVGDRVHDPRRVSFLARYLAALRRSMEEGSDVRGYFLWSLMDNFEWSYGTEKRFGIVYVDYPSQRRIIKDSGLWYRDLIRRSRGGRAHAGG